MPDEPFLRWRSRGYLPHLDAPLGRTPKEAEEGKLSTYVGGDDETFAAVKPVFDTYADTVIHVGPLGMGHTLKLINNFISIGTAAVILLFFLIYVVPQFEPVFKDLGGRLNSGAALIVAISSTRSAVMNVGS